MDFLTALEQLDLESTQPQTDATDSAAVVVLAFRCKCIEITAILIIRWTVTQKAVTLKIWNIYIFDVSVTASLLFLV